VVELHGGTVTASSAGRDQGATFTVQLPQVTEHVSRGGESGATAPRPLLVGASVLIVDDDPDTREIAATALATAGAEVETAPSADHAFKAIEHRRFSVLVCDIGMPGTDGYELLARVRDSDAAHGRFTPAIALTAYASHDDVARAQASGFFAHVAKPFTIATLVDAVTAAAGSFRSQAPRA
jgi:CheY-like chemotaxis protein